MKKILVEDAIGMKLCHDITEITDGFKGVAFRRGHIIREEDVPHLQNIGKRTVFIWEDCAGEIHEDDCARRLGAAARGEGMRCTEPAEGKVVLIADRRGMLRLNRKLLKNLNSIGDITICTLPDRYPVEVGTRLASMRIVPLVTRETQMIEAERLCRVERLLEIKPYRHMKAGVIITGSEVYFGRIPDKFGPMIRAKLRNYPSDIVGISMCDDDPGMIADAAGTYLEKGADLLIFTGGMSVDPDDQTPTAIRRLGAQIVSQGIPAQPGNMTLVAYLGDVPVLGVPGAAVKVPVTILDVLLPRIFAGERLTKEDLINLADGGLCQLCEVCHWPNCTFGRC